MRVALLLETHVLQPIADIILEYATKNLWQYGDYVVKNLWQHEWLLRIKPWSEPTKDPIGFYFYHPQHSKTNLRELIASDAYKGIEVSQSMFLHLWFRHSREMYRIESSQMEEITDFLRRRIALEEQLDIDG